MSKDKHDQFSECIEHCEKHEAPGDVIDDGDFQRLSRSVVRKLDMTLLPIVWVLYLFNYIDRNSISQAKLAGLEKDLHLKGEDFNVVVSILNVGYITMQLPSNLILTRVRPSIYLPLFVCIWSAVSASTAAASNYKQLLAIRFILGISEAPFFPGVFYLLSCWYTRRELALRTAILYSGVILATAFSGLIAAGVFAQLAGAQGIASWRWLFIIEGALSFAFGLLALVVLPDFPGKRTGSARWLFNEEEHRVAGLRIERDRTAVEEGSKSVWYGLQLAVKDYRTWVFALMLISNHTAYGFNYFYPTIVKGFNLGSETITLVCTAPPYLLATCTAMAIAYSSDRLGERGYHIAGPMLVATVGFIITVATFNVAVRYFASFLFICGCFSANAGVFSWVSGSLGQTPEKKAAAVALVNLLSQLGNIWSPYFFDPNDSPRYTLAMILMMAFALLSVACCAVMKWSLKRENRKILASWDGEGERPNLFTL